MEQNGLNVFLTADPYALMEVSLSDLLDRL